MKHLQQSPFYRRQMTPWYDTNAVCWVLIICMLAVLGFALTGVWVARTQSTYHGMLWVPLSLALMSAGVIVSTLWRLVKRRMGHSSE